MHILDRPCACAACGRDTVRSYGTRNVPICVICKMAAIRPTAEHIGGRTWGSRWEVVMSALKAMATRGGIKLARIERGRP